MSLGGSALLHWRSQQLKDINQVLFGDDRYKQIRDRCNDHTHYNYYQHVMLNDNEIRLPNRAKWLDRALEDLQDLFLLHFAWTFCLNDHYMASSDYLDALECGLTPNEDSQYWVARFVQEMLDSAMRPRRHGIYEAIKKETSMELS